VLDQLPGGSADGPAASISAAATVVSGGSVQHTVTSEREFSVVTVAQSLPTNYVVTVHVAGQRIATFAVSAG
jgi:hypothetical protein